jgi:hypothetical protein
MHAFKFLTLITLILCSFLTSCKDKNNAQVHFVIKFDPLQERLSANGMSTPIPAGRAVQTPNMNQIGVESLELVANNTTPVGKGLSVFQAAPRVNGSDVLTDFDQLKKVGDGATIVSIPFKKLAVGKYEYVRLAVAYQNFDILFSIQEVPFAGNFTDERGTFAVFLGKSNFIGSHTIASKSEKIDGVKPQGYWVFETKFPSAYVSLNRLFSGKVPDSTLTFVNPLYQTAALPVGSNFITARFDTPLSITGQENQDVTVVLTLSTNKSFEWDESILKNNKWDSNAQANTGQPSVERAVDVGFRGMKARYEMAK